MDRREFFQTSIIADARGAKSLATSTLAAGADAAGRAARRRRGTGRGQPPRRRRRAS